MSLPFSIPCSICWSGSQQETNAVFQKGSCRELEAGTVDSQGLGASPGWRTPGLATAGSRREPVPRSGAGAATAAARWRGRAGRQGSHLLFIPPSWPGAGGRALGRAVCKRLATRTQRRVGRWKGGLGGKQYPVEPTHQTGTQGRGEESLGLAFQWAGDHLEFPLPPDSGPH